MQCMLLIYEDENAVREPQAKQVPVVAGGGVEVRPVMTY